MYFVETLLLRTGHVLLKRAINYVTSHDDMNVFNPGNKVFQQCQFSFIDRHHLVRGWWRLLLWRESFSLAPLLLSSG